MTGPGVRAYSSTVTAREPIVAGAVIGAATAAWMLVVLPDNPIGPLAGVVVILTGIFVATVRLSVGRHQVVVGQGPLGWPSRVVPTTLVADAYAADVTRAQGYGLGVGWHRLTTRMTVRPGPTLVLALTTGELIRISTRDPAAAVAVIRSAAAEAAPRDTTGGRNDNERE